MTDIKEIIKAGLKCLGYDGLLCPDADCACDGSAPCDESPLGCEGAYKHLYCPQEFDDWYSLTKCTGENCEECSKWREWNEEDDG